MRFPRNTATNFALVGAAIASVVAFGAFGWFWIYLPGGIAALASMYAVSIWLGSLADARAKKLFGCLLAGVGVAIATLVAGIIALGNLNIVLAWLEDVTSLRTGMGPYHSLLQAIEDFVVAPLYWVSLFGGWIAIFLGLLYGTTLYARNKSSGS